MYISYHLLFIDDCQGKKEAVEGLFLNMSEFTKVNLNPTAFLGMDNVRLLKVYDPQFHHVVAKYSYAFGPQFYDGSVSPQVDDSLEQFRNGDKVYCKSFLCRLNQ